MHLKNTVAQFFLAILVTAISVYMLVNVWKLSASGTPTEGFGAPARGAGIPDCLRTSQEASDIYEVFSNKLNTTEEGPDDLRELTLLLSKTSCMKKDLMSPSGIVEATRYQSYSTAHDIEPVAETVARCLAKTIPERDLDIGLDKWNVRGKELIRKLCTSFKVSDSEMNKLDKSFKKHMADITDIAKSQCLKGDVEIGGKKGPRDVNAYEPPELGKLKEYKGYY